MQDSDMGEQATFIKQLFNWCSRDQLIKQPPVFYYKLSISVRQELMKSKQGILGNNARLHPFSFFSLSI